MAPTYIKMLINKNVHNSVPKPQEAEMELKLLAASHQVKVVQTNVRSYCCELFIYHEVEPDFRNYIQISTTSAMFYCWEEFMKIQEQ